MLFLEGEDHMEVGHRLGEDSVTLHHPARAMSDEYRLRVNNPVIAKDMGCTPQH